VARRVDALGVVVVVLAVGWTFVTGRDGAHPWPVVGAWCLALAGVVAGRLSVRRHAALPTAAVAAAVGGAVLLTWPGITELLGGPLGYSNANASLCGLGAVAAVATATRLPRRPDRGAVLIGALALTGAAAVTGSLAATIVLVGTLALVTVARALRRLDLVAPFCIVACSLTLGVTLAIAVNADPSPSDATRVRLWSHAATLVEEHRVEGVGPGNFQDSSAESSDPDTRHAHHDFLEYAAEQGVVGLLLLLAAVALAYATVWVAHDGTTRTALGAAAVTVVALHATVDYVLHLPQLVAVAGVLVGATTALPPGVRPRKPVPVKPPVSPAVIALARGRTGRRR
jgi:hypothetical protein